MSNVYYTRDLEKYKIDDFIYYRHIDTNQIYMCYNSAHSKTWSKVFNINSEDDIERTIQYTYDQVEKYGSYDWFTDQKIMYSKLINYPNLKVLNRQVRRLETWVYAEYIRNNITKFIHNYDDAHFHRDYFSNLRFIMDAEKQLIRSNLDKIS